jgi:hypothetical protein
MSSNDLILLNQLLKQRITEIGPDLAESDFFEMFSAEQVLKDYDLSYEEIQDGIVDNGGDGGIDSTYFFINDSLYHEDDDYGNLKKGIRLQLVFIQSKISQGFSETGMDKFIAAMRDLLDLNKSIESLKPVYNQPLLDKITQFRETYIKLTSKFPDLNVLFYYVAKADDLHPNVERKKDQLGDVIKTLFNPCKYNFDFVGASKLLSLARQSPSSAHPLKFIENPISPGEEAYVCLVNIRDFFNFIVDDSGKLKKSIFEGNVRDYQGKTEVNEHIANTLQSQRPKQEDFWWLNNGVTILCSKATVSGKILTIEDPEIVNGLQTSNEMFNFFAAQSTFQDQRNILVRVIKPESESSRDRIIRATNSQTPIPIASLRATDKIHRDIEDYLQSHGIFYDRRKNYYKNQGKPIRNIVSIPSMAQAVLSCALLDPSNARGRPSSLLKDDNAYLKIFSPGYPIDLYLKCISITRQVESFLKSKQVNLVNTEFNNLRFYIAMLVSCKLSKVPRPQPGNVANISISDITDALLGDCLNIARNVYNELGGTDQVAKGKDFSQKLQEAHFKEVTASLRNAKAE